MDFVTGNKKGHKYKIRKIRSKANGKAMLPGFAYFVYFLNKNTIIIISDG